MSEIILMVSLSLIFGSILIFLEYFLSKKSSVGKEKEYLEMLPGYNCGACGYGSCAGMAQAMLKDPEAYKKCKPMKKEMKEKIEEYLKTSV